MPLAFRSHPKPTSVQKRISRSRIHQRRAGGKINTNAFVREPTLLNDQPVIRMNRDTLYGGVVIDTDDGATVTVPKAEDGRYVSVLVLDNDHYAPAVYYEPGTYDLPTDTRYVTLLYRVQLLDDSNPDDVAKANALQDQFVVMANSAVPFPPHNGMSTACWPCGRNMKLSSRNSLSSSLIGWVPAGK